MKVIVQYVRHLLSRSTYMSDAAWKKARYAFQTIPPLSPLSQPHSCVTFLAGFHAQIYDCCPNSCLCYTGPHSSATSCTYCRLSWYHSNETQKPHKKFTYLSLIPRLQAFRANTRIVTAMQYRSQSESKSIPGVIKDKLYLTVRTTRHSNQKTLGLTRSSLDTDTLMTTVT